MTTLVIIAKECIPGRVKTRLHPDVSFEQAAALAAASLADTLAVGAALPAERRILAYDGIVPPPESQLFEVLPQSTGDLDARLAAVFDTVSGPTVLVGMDTPQLRTADLAGLFPWPADTDFAFGAADDGGFWSLGMREPRGDLIRGIPMSRDDTGARQLERLRAAGGRIRMLSPLTDIDTISEARAVADLAPATRFSRAFAQIMLERQPVGAEA